MDLNKAREIMNEFMEASRMETGDLETPGIKVEVLQLMAGDLVYHPMAGYYVFVCRGQHPIWSPLQAVVWCDSQGRLSIDALDPHQVLQGTVINRTETQEERARRFRAWYLERKN
jgi:hypothetical protein